VGFPAVDGGAGVGAIALILIQINRPDSGRFFFVGFGRPGAVDKSWTF
jgi:hypothetical protein